MPKEREWGQSRRSYAFIPKFNLAFCPGNCYFLVDKIWNRDENSMNISDCCNNRAQILCLNCLWETLSHLLFTYLVNRKNFWVIYQVPCSIWVLVQQYWHTGKTHGEYLFLSVRYKYRGRPTDICESGWGRGREKEKRHRSASNLVSYWPSLLQHWTSPVLTAHGLQSHPVGLSPLI